MTRFIVYSLFLILANSHLILAMANSKEVPTAARKLGSHELSGAAVSPAEAPKAAEIFELSASEEESGGAAQDQVMESTPHHHHRSIDKSVAGGGVILGGLATTFLVAIICYIRATGRKAAEPSSPTSSSIGGKTAEIGSPTNSSLGGKNVELSSPKNTSN